MDCVGRMKRVACAVILIFGFFGAGCMKKDPLPPEWQDYAGNWVSDDDSYLEIRLDGNADFVSTNLKIYAARVEIEGHTLSLHKGLRRESFRITREPRKRDELWVLELNGFPYYRE